MIVHWPNGMKDANKLRHDPCHFVDVLPTLVDLAGGSTAANNAPPLAGRSFAPALRKDGGPAREFCTSTTTTIAPSAWEIGS